MMTFKSSADLSCLQETDPAHPVISRMIEYDALSPNNLIALMEPQDMGSRSELWNHCTPDKTSLEGILHLQQHGMYLVVLQTQKKFGIAVVIPNASWLIGSELQRCIQLNLKH